LVLVAQVEVQQIPMERRGQILFLVLSLQQVVGSAQSHRLVVEAAAREAVQVLAVPHLTLAALVRQIKALLAAMVTMAHVQVAVVELEVQALTALHPLSLQAQMAVTALHLLLLDHLLLALVALVAVVITEDLVEQVVVVMALADQKTQLLAI
jgi:hypothetical protein